MTVQAWLRRLGGRADSPAHKPRPQTPDQRSEALLLAHLTPVQANQYLHTGGFLQQTTFGLTLIGGRKEWTLRRLGPPALWTYGYREYGGQAPGEEYYMYGFYPKNWDELPMPDILLAQYLRVRYGDPVFLRLQACRQAVRGACILTMNDAAIRLLRRGRLEPAGQGRGRGHPTGP